MSDNTSEEEQQQQMQEIFICADVWLEVFAFLSPFELGHIMALLSDRFNALVDMHFKSRKWSLGSMEIRRAIGGNGAQIVVKRSGELLPIPQGPLPNKVTGFEEIQISYIDQTVIEFLQRIRRLFDSSETTVWFELLSDDQSRSWEIIWHKIWPFVNDNICCLCVDYFELDRLQQFSPTILLDCPKLRLIDSDGFFPVDDDDDDDAFSAVAKWLLTARGDARPKIFRDCFTTGVEGLKWSFVNASEPFNFIIKFCICDGDAADMLVPFELKNNRTGERLTLRHFNEYFCFLVRCPIVREEAKWAKWEEEAAESTLSFWNRITIDFKDSDIGDDMVDAKAGPSAPKK